MGRKELVAAVCWLALSNTWAFAKKASNKLEDSVGEASTVSRLYRNIPFGVYASASPYAAFSFHVPTFATSPRLTQLGPIKQESVVIENTHGFLKDSYGNKFVESPQRLAYRTTFPQQYVQLQELPAHLAQPLVSAAPSYQFKQTTPHFFGPPQFNVQSLQSVSPSNRYGINQHAFSGSLNSLAPVQQQQLQQHQQQQQRPTNNQVVYANTHAAEQFQNLKNVGKSQRLQESPNSHEEISTGPAPQVTKSEKAQLKTAATAASANKGKKAVINLVTNPPVPLLDLSLLEPLTFANPLVPQVQHFLPRIASVKYHKLPEVNVNEVKKEMKQFIIENTKSYDSGIVKGKPKGKAPKKSHSKPEADEEEGHREHVTPTPTGTPDDISNEEPEIVYEINSPNYQETYKEKVVSYNKETMSEPVHYNYEKKTEKEPVHYNYVHSSKEPLQVKNVQYESDQNSKQLVYHFKPEHSNENHNENQNENHNENHSSEHKKPEDSPDEPREGEGPSQQDQQSKGRAYEKETHYEKPEHREEQYHHSSGKNIPHHYHHNAPQEYSQVKKAPVDNPDTHFQPIITEYEEDIRILPSPKPYATIKVNPNQHVQHGHVSPRLNTHQTREPQHRPHNHPDTHSRSHYHPEQINREKPKPIIIQEETPDEEPDNEQLNEEGAEQDKESEENFEQGYKNAAFGFPAYDTNPRDSEKEIYNPDPYGRAQYHTDFDIEHSPFQQYQVAGDKFPKSTRSNYKDARDKTKEEYYLDYAISRPESLIARYRQKEDYYKMFMKQKPQYLLSERDSNKKNQKQLAKYTAAPAFEYNSSAQKPKQYFAKYKVAPRPQTYEYDYSKEAPKDNSAHATRPHQRFKTHTQFVEPQFQYGFEPSALPRLLDSELAAMASNNSPESEKPGTRKNIYKEKWYIRKTSTDDRKAAS